MVTETEAKCSICGEIKPIKDFRANTGQWKGRPFRLSFCNKCRRIKINTRLNGDVFLFLQSRMTQIKSRARDKNIEFNITPEYLKQLYDKQEGKCFYTDIPMTTKYGVGKLLTALSIDRIDTTKGYIIGNVVLCTNRINSIKSDLTLEEIREWIPKIYERIKTNRNS